MFWANIVGSKSRSLFNFYGISINEEDFCVHVCGKSCNQKTLT